jgi:hypothetical protein
MRKSPLIEDTLTVRRACRKNIQVPLIMQMCLISANHMERLERGGRRQRWLLPRASLACSLTCVQAGIA